MHFKFLLRLDRGFLLLLFELDHFGLEGVQGHLPFLEAAEDEDEEEEQGSAGSDGHDNGGVALVGFEEDLG